MVHQHHPQRLSAANLGIAVTDVQNFGHHYDQCSSTQQNAKGNFATILGTFVGRKLIARVNIQAIGYDGKQPERHCETLEATNRDPATKSQPVTMEDFNVGRNAHPEVAPQAAAQDVNKDIIAGYATCDETLPPSVPTDAGLTANIDRYKQFLIAQKAEHVSRDNRQASW